MIRRITTNLVKIRRNSTGFNTLGDFLCNSCGRRNICFLPPTKACNNYIPTMKFRDLSGTEGRFATFRSRTWADVLRLGMEVGICDAETVSLHRIAIVQEIHCGDRGEMEEIYGPLSHISIGKPFDLEEYRRARVKQIGPMIYNFQKQVAVIILE